MNDDFIPWESFTLDGPMYSASADAPIPDAIAKDGRFEQNWPQEWTRLPATSTYLKVEYFQTPRLRLSPQLYLDGWLPMGWLGRLAAESLDGSARAIFLRARVVGVSRRGMELDLETPEGEKHAFKVWVAGPPPVVKTV